MKKILFMGTPDYATTIFDALVNSAYEIVGLFTQPDKKVGRKQLLTPPHIKQYYLNKELTCPLFQPEKLRGNIEVFEQIKALQPDYIVVAAFGQILPKEVLDIAPCINLHASLLPLYRGASPIQEALLNDDTFTGVTSMLMEEGLDTGDILGLEYLKITPTMLVDEAFNKLSIIAAQLTLKTLERFENIQPKEQNNALSSHCKKIKKEHGEVNFCCAKSLFLKYKAYAYWPGVFTSDGLKLKEISLREEDSINKEGEVLDFTSDSIVIGCAKGSIQIKTIQAPSKKAVSALDYIRGKRLNKGDILI